MIIQKKQGIDVSGAIKAFRQKHHLTQEQLAAKLEVSHMQIMRWENRKTFPNRLSIKALVALKIIPPPRIIEG